MRTPYTSVGAVDQFHPQDPNPDTTSSHPKMQQQQQQQTIYHPNALRQRYSSTAGVSGGSSQTDNDDRDKKTEEGRRSRRASIDRRGSFDRRRSIDASPPVKKQRFEILRKLGSGTYGKVSLAMDHRTGEEVAVKVIKKSAIENTADLIRIRREIRIMSALKHPHIIEIKEVFENDEKIILVMEYSSGGELYDYVSSHGPLDENEVRRLFRQIVSAVYYCHKHGVAHRDLKLENILLDAKMEAKIADFGLSNYFKPNSLLHTFCGSPLYASPEIINGTPYRGPEVDCWSLGVLLYTLAYSSMPFDGRDFNRMIRQIKRGAYYEPDPPSSASTLIRSMLRVNSDRRADIVSIAGHWWLNHDENQPAISTLEENQVLDKTPLYIRQETLMIQSLGEESEIFAEYTHLSESTRKKIEEFRRRKQEADWYLTGSQSPLKKSKKRSSSVLSDRKRQSSHIINQKQASRDGMPSPSTKQDSQIVVGKPPPSPAHSPRHGGTDYQPTPATSVATAHAPAQRPTPVPSAATVAAHAPLAQPPTPVPSASVIAGKVMEMDYQTTPMPSSTAVPGQQQQVGAADAEARNATEEATRLMESLRARTQYAEETEAGPLMEDQSMATFRPFPRRPPSMVLKEVIQPERSRCFIHSLAQPELLHREPEPPAAPAPTKEAPVDPVIVEEANRLIDELMEEALRGPVSPDTVEKIRASPAYEKEQFVKEILEAVLVAQQPRPVTSRSMYSFRYNRSRSKHSSMSRMPPSTSPSSTTPLPDMVACQDTDLPSSATPPPPDVAASFNEDIFSAPTAQLTITLPHHKIIHQTVPEETELEFAGSGSEVASGRQAAVPEGEEEEEEEDEDEDEEEDEEEDVYSTDFEDMEEPSSSSEDAEDDSLGSVKDETDIELEQESDIVPISTVDSCASIHSNIVPSPEPLPESPLPIDDTARACSELGKDQVPSEQPQGPTTPAPVRKYRRVLSKRISRGKYERSTFKFCREIAIEDSPRANKNKIGGVQPECKDAPKLFQKAKQYILQFPNQERFSPERPHEGRRRRYSDGDQKPEEQQPVVYQIGSIANPGAVIFDALKTKHPSPYSVKEKPAISCFDADVLEAQAPRFFEDGDDEDGMVVLSMNRRKEREKERENIMNDYLLNGHYGDSVPDGTDTSESPQTPTKKRTYVTGGDAKSAGAIEPSMLQVATKTRRSSAEPLLDILEAGGGQPDEYDLGTATYGMPITINNLVRPVSSSILNAELRRYSYRSVDSADDGDSEDNALSMYPASSSPVVSEERADGRIGCFSPTAALTELQFTKEDHSRQTHYNSGYTGYTSPGSERTRVASPTASSHERTEDDYYNVRPHGNSYRSRSVFVTTPRSREMSPAQGRSLMSPVRTGPLDSPAAAYYYDSRRQKAKSWYTAGDKAAGSFEEALMSTHRRDAANAVGVANYFRSFFDVAYTRVPRMPDVKRGRERTPVFLPNDSSSSRRRSRSVDKSQYAIKIAAEISSRRYHPPGTPNNVAYMPNDRVDVAAHRPYQQLDTSVGMNMQNVGGPGRFQGLLLHAKSTRRLPADKVPSKGILKKQAPVFSYNTEVETSRKLSNGDNKRPVTFMDRIRRHLSTDKPAAESAVIGKQRTSRAESASPDSSKSTSKKRSLLDIARRRTIATTSGNDSGFGSGSISSDDYNPTTTKPVEKFKGFLSSNQSAKSARDTTGNSYHSYKPTNGPSAYMTAYKKPFNAAQRPRAYASARY